MDDHVVDHPVRERARSGWRCGSSGCSACTNPSEWSCRRPSGSRVGRAGGTSWRGRAPARAGRCDPRTPRRRYRACMSSTHFRSSAALIHDGIVIRNTRRRAARRRCACGAPIGRPRRGTPVPRPVPRAAGGSSRSDGSRRVAQVPWHHGGLEAGEVLVQRAHPPRPLRAPRPRRERARAAAPPRRPRPRSPRTSNHEPPRLPM